MVEDKEEENDHIFILVAEEKRTYVKKNTVSLLTLYVVKWKKIFEGRRQQHSSMARQNMGKNSVVCNVKSIFLL